LCSALGYSGTVLIPEDMPLARIAQIKSFGATVVFTPRFEYVSGVIQGLRSYLRLQKGSGRSIYCQNHAESQYSVEGVSTCGREILAQLQTRGIDHPDFFFAALGGGIHVKGIGEVLLDAASETQLIGVEPYE